MLECQGDSRTCAWEYLANECSICHLSDMFCYELTETQETFNCVALLVAGCSAKNVANTFGILPANPPQDYNIVHGNMS